METFSAHKLNLSNFGKKKSLAHFKPMFLTKQTDYSLLNHTMPNVEFEFQLNANRTFDIAI